MSESDPDGDQVRRVLYRCRTPTNFLCPCGAVARRLGRLGLEHEVERIDVGERVAVAGVGLREHLERVLRAQLRRQEVEDERGLTEARGAFGDRGAGGGLAGHGALHERAQLVAVEAIGPGTVDDHAVNVEVVDPPRHGRTAA